MSTIKTAIEDLFNPQISTGKAVNRHFAPSFRQRTNGTWDDRETFAARIGSLRADFKLLEVTVLDEHDAGTRYAERHVIELRNGGGERIRQEIYLFAERDSEGRFVRIEETSLRIDA